jgi:hypothetical protein
MVVAAGVALATGILSDAVSPVLVLDLVSFWPAGLLAVVALAIALPLRRAHPRLIAVPALILLTWMILATGAYLAGWPLLPSGQATVVGFPVSATAGRMTVGLDRGRLVVAEGGVASYSVSPLREGGPVGAPQVVERLASGELQLVVEERPPDRWYRFSGWRVGLAPGITWTLDLEAPMVEADLRTVPVSSTRVAGSGWIRLGAGTGRVGLAGDLEVEVPPGVPVEVTGEAGVPPDWVAGDGGSRAPAEGEGWTLVVAPGSTVVVRYP